MPRRVGGRRDGNADHAANSVTKKSGGRAPGLLFAGGAPFLFVACAYAIGTAWNG
jgi:hypothetical protein